MVTGGWTRRNFLRRVGAAGAVVIGGPTVLSACSRTPEGGGGEGGTLERIQDAGSVKIGIAGEVPYGFTEDGEVTGEAPEVAKAVFKAMGIEDVEAEQVEFGQLIQALNANQFDMVAAGMAILPERCQNAAFSSVDYVTPTAFMVPEGNPEGVSNFQDIKDKGLSVAVLSGTVEQAVAEATGISDGNIKPYEGQPELFQALVNERAYCGALTDISLKQLKEDNPDEPLEVTDGFVPEIDGQEQIQAGGFVFRQGEDDLLEAFNEELEKLHSSGEWLEIVKPFGFTEDNVPPDDLTTQELCEAEDPTAD